MKTGFLVSTLVALVLAVVVVMGMGQISGLKKEMADLKKEVPAKSAKGRTAVGTGARISRPALKAYERKTSARGEEDEEAEEQSEVEKLVKQAEDNPEELLGDLIKAFSESDFGQNFSQRGPEGYEDVSPGLASTSLGSIATHQVVQFYGFAWKEAP